MGTAPGQSQVADILAQVAEPGTEVPQARALEPGPCAQRVPRSAGVWESGQDGQTWAAPEGTVTNASARGLPGGGALPPHGLPPLLALGCFPPPDTFALSSLVCSLPLQMTSARDSWEQPVPPWCQQLGSSSAPCGHASRAHRATDGPCGEQLPGSLPTVPHQPAGPGHLGRVRVDRPGDHLPPGKPSPLHLPRDPAPRETWPRLSLDLLGRWDLKQWPLC